VTAEQSTAVIPDALPSYAEMATKNDRWWYGLGYWEGFEAGSAKVYDELEDRYRRNVATRVSAVMPPSLDALRARRAEPGPLAEAWRARHSGEFHGVLAEPVAWGAPVDGPSLGYPRCEACGWPPNDRRHCCRYRKDDR
jgi:hypothetical protein